MYIDSSHICPKWVPDLGLFRSSSLKCWKHTRFAQKSILLLQWTMNSYDSHTNGSLAWWYIHKSARTAPMCLSKHAHILLVLTQYNNLNRKIVYVVYSIGIIYVVWFGFNATKMVSHVRMAIATWKKTLQDENSLVIFVNISIKLAVHPRRAKTQCSSARCAL